MSDTFVPQKPASFSTVEELEKLVVESDNDGEELEMTAAEWDRLHQDIEHDSLLRRKAS